MRNRLRLGLIAAIALCCLPLAGCDMGILNVRITDFESSQVVGIKVWTRPPNATQFQLLAQYKLLVPTLRDGNEEVPYAFVDDQGVEYPALMTAMLDRNPQDVDDVTLTFFLSKAVVSVEYKVSTYNAAGDSALSVGSSYL